MLYYSVYSPGSTCPYHSCPNRASTSFLVLLELYQVPETKRCAFIFGRNPGKHNIFLTYPQLQSRCSSLINAIMAMLFPLLVRMTSLLLPFFSFPKVIIRAARERRHDDINEEMCFQSSMNVVYPNGCTFTYHPWDLPIHLQ